MTLWDWKSRFYDFGRRLFPFNLILTRELKRIEVLLSQMELEEMRVLDVGSGTGAVLKQLLRTSKAIGVDRSWAMIHRARRKRCKELVVADANRLPFKRGVFTLVTAVGLFEYLTDRNAFLTELKHVVAKDGWVVLTYSQPSVLNYARWLLLQRLHFIHDGDYRAFIESAGFQIRKSSRTLMQRQLLLRQSSGPTPMGLSEATSLSAREPQ